MRPAPDRPVIRNSALVVQRIAGTCSTVRARRARLSTSRAAAAWRSGSPSNPIHTPASSSATRSRPRRSTPSGGRGSSRRTRAIHQRCSSRRLATQRYGGGRAPGNSPSMCSAASSSPARGARSSELEARRCSRPRASASHTPTARPPRVTAARRRTSCHIGSGPRERAGLIESPEAAGRAATAERLEGVHFFTPLVILPPVDCRSQLFRTSSNGVGPWTTVASFSRAR